jgi:hypothetical protein
MAMLVDTDPPAESETEFEVVPREKGRVGVTRIQRKMGACADPTGCDPTYAYPDEAHSEGKVVSLAVYVTTPLPVTGSVCRIPNLAPGGQGGSSNAIPVKPFSSVTVKVFVKVPL